VSEDGRRNRGDTIHFCESRSRKEGRRETDFAQLVGSETAEQGKDGYVRLIDVSFVTS